MKSILEIRLNPDFAKTTLIKGRIHSQFSRVVNIEFLQEQYQPRLITLLPPGFTGIPDSMVVETPHFMKISSLPVGTTVVKRNLSFTFDGIEEIFEGDKANFYSDYLDSLYCESDKFGRQKFNNFLSSLESFYIKVNKQDGFSRLPSSVCLQVLRKHHSLCNSLIKGNINEIEKKFASCVGVGCGLTPSSDDAIVGILATVKSGILGVEMPHIDTFKIWRQLAGLTTDISRKYLCCAVEGRFPDVLRNLLTAALTREKLDLDYEKYLYAVAEVGSTSGMDMLKGIEVAFREVLEIRCS